MTVDAAVGPPPSTPPLAIDRPVAPPSSSPSSDRLRPATPSSPPGAGSAPPLPGESRSPGAPEAERLRAQLRDPALRVTSFRDETSGRFVLQVTDRASGEVVDQYPPERLLRLFAAMRGAEAGGGSGCRCGLVDERA